MQDSHGPAADHSTPVLDWLLLLARHRWWLAAGVLAGGVTGYGLSFTAGPSFTARATILPPQQQGSIAGAMAALGGLSALAGGAVSIKSPADQYITLMQSVRVADRLIDAFDLQKTYDVTTRLDARRILERNTRIGAARKDTLITIEVDDGDPARAAAIANRYVEELRQLSSQLALSEAQQRRAFFERELQATKQRLAAAQVALQGSGFNAGALRAEPKAAAEAYGKLRAEMTQAEIQLQGLRKSFTDEMPEVQRQLALLAAMRAQLARLEEPRRVEEAGSADYVSRLREYKYQEAMFEIFARQYETARLDEAREGTIVQVVDAATPPERRAHPKRRVWAMVSALLGLAGVLLGITVRHLWRAGVNDPILGRKLRAWRSAPAGRD